MNKAKKYFVTEIMKFDPNKMSLCTILFEGSKQEVEYQQKIVYALAKKYKGFKAGAENGERGYFLTFMIGYLRDFGFKYNFIAESFETSLPWKDVAKMCTAVNKRIVDDCKRLGVKREPFISYRVTQVYDTGAVVYVYFGFLYHGLQDPVAVYSEVEDAARDEIMKYGGCISHHHGVGKLRKKFLPRSIGNTGIELIRGVKNTVDPTNIFATGNLIDK